MRAFRSLGALVAIAVLLSGCLSETTDPTREPTLEPQTIAAVAPACDKLPVAGAGSLITDGSALNHVVLLDTNGAAFDWTEWVPPEWRPTSVADAELVVCVGEPVREVVQVCDFYGGDITRYEVSRSLLAVEPSTGREVSSFSIVARPRICHTTESASTTELVGTIDDDMVSAHLAGLVEHGVFVDPPDSAIDGTTLPSAVAPSTVPTTSPEKVELRQALADGLVSAIGTGDGLERLDLEITSKVDRALEVSIEAGTLLEPRARATQTMVVVWDVTVDLAAGGTESMILDVSCMQMHQDQPTSDDTFTVADAAADTDIGRLLAEPTVVLASGRVRQFAIWTITNNPRKDDFVPLGTTFDVFGTGPDKDELTAIRDLFEAAGIDPSDYRALR